jgi:hypothetical protein
VQANFCTFNASIRGKKKKKWLVKIFKCSSAHHVHIVPDQIELKGDGSFDSQPLYFYTTDDSSSTSSALAALDLGR